MKKSLSLVSGILSIGLIQCGSANPKSQVSHESSTIESESWQAFPASVVSISHLSQNQIALKLAHASGWNIKAVRLNPETKCSLVSFPPACETVLEVQGAFNGQEMGVTNTFTLDLPKPKF
jgi:hypothetical protein